ncbi:MAG TPA: homoserine kinase [Woeseiaceae bacterium]|nr:homoserine kinase [Woeseiaceae bacterium]
MDKASAFAPASIGNLAVGFDMLGLAIAGAGDRVTARRTPAGGVHLDEVYGLDGRPHGQLSGEATQNTAGIAAAALWRAHGTGGGLRLAVYKGVPLQSGMGSSAASAVAGAVAANALLDEPLPLGALLPFALEGEQFASGGLHADNVAPSLLGGLVLCPPILLPEVRSLPVPRGVSSVVLHPDLEVNTAESRRSLARGYSMDQWLTQQGYLAGFIAACMDNDHELLRRCLRDVIIEPQRSPVVPCFAAVRDAALAADAFGCSLSGSGPSIFALGTDAAAPGIAAAMTAACRGQGVDCQTWISPMTAAGARVEAAA